MSDQSGFAGRFAECGPDDRREWAERLLKSLEKSDSMVFLESMADKLRIAASIDSSVNDLLEARGETLEGVISAAYLKEAKKYFQMLDKPMHFDDKSLLLGKFQPGVEFENYYFRLEQLKEAMQKAGVESVLDEPGSTGASMEEAIAQKLRNVHLERARSWYSALQVSSFEDGEDTRKVNPLLAVMRLQYHVQQAGGDYAALDADGDYSAEQIKKSINRMAGEIWINHYADAIPSVPKLTDEIITPDQDGRHNGIYVFSPESDMAMASARLQCANLNPDVTIREILDAVGKTGLPLSELFPESGLTSKEIVDVLRDHFVDTLLREVNVNPDKLDSFTKEKAIRKYKVDKTLKESGFDGLSR